MKKSENIQLTILTNEEYNLLNNITSQTKTDCWFCLETDEKGFDYVTDLENGCKLSIKTAVEQLNEAILPDLINLTDEEVKLYTNLLKKLKVIDNPFEIYNEVYKGNANGIYTDDII